MLCLATIILIHKILLPCFENNVSHWILLITFDKRASWAFDVKPMQCLFIINQEASSSNKTLFYWRSKVILPIVPLNFTKILILQIKPRVFKLQQVDTLYNALHTWWLVGTSVRSSQDSSSFSFATAMGLANFVALCVIYPWTRYHRLPILYWQDRLAECSYTTDKQHWKILQMMVLSLKSR